MTQSGELTTGSGETVAHDIRKVQNTISSLILMPNQTLFPNVRQRSAESDILISDISIEGIHIEYHQAPFPSHFIRQIQINTPGICMCFNLLSGITLSGNIVDSLRSYLVFMSSGSYRLVSTGDMELYMIFIPLDKFLYYLPAGHPLGLALQDITAADTSGAIVQHSGYLTPATQRVLTEIHHHLSGTHNSPLLLRSRIFELIFLQLDQYEREDIPGAATVRETEREKMLLARELIIGNPSRRLSLRTLAREVGTNEYNLKKNFKAVFGVPVLSYSNMYKMEQARKMILQGKESISGIALQMGYKHSTHFSAAFKKYFGYLPHQVKNLLLWIQAFLTNEWNVACYGIDIL